LRQSTTTFVLDSPGPGLSEFTASLRGWLDEIAATEGLLTLQVQHTSASLVVQENADPQVQADLEAFFRRLVPPGDPLFEHRAEGPDDMPAHVRSALTSTTLSLPVREGRLALGTWQGVYLFEHRDRPHRRRIVAHFLGD
jgi:secondary thiamine-phosphate synthase enzyme